MTSPRSETRAPEPASSPSALVAVLEHIEGNDRLDRPAAVVERVAGAVAPAGLVRDALTGRWMGHALHPLMTDLPIGFWTSTTVLDLVGGPGARPAARALLAAGNLAAVPTVATGLAEWLLADRDSRRVGVVHANAGTVGLALYTGSYLARRRGRHGWGAGLALAGMAAATVAGYLGGHLVVARKVGTRDPWLSAAPGPG